jgi:hypothetical protein
MSPHALLDQMHALVGQMLEMIVIIGFIVVAFRVVLYCIERRHEHAIDAKYCNAAGSLLQRYLVFLDDQQLALEIAVAAHPSDSYAIALLNQVKRERIHLATLPVDDISPLESCRIEREMRELQQAMQFLPAK